MARRLAQCAFAVGLLLALAAPARAADDDTTIALGVGTSKVLNVPGVTRISIGDESVADVKPLGSNQLLVLGKSEGKTTLIIWKSNNLRLSYTISVRKDDPDNIIREIKGLLGDIEGITVRKVGDRIYLDGYAYTSDDYDRVERILNLYSQVKSFVKVAPNAKKLVANNLNAALQRAGLKNVQANVVGTTIFLEGSVESQQDLQKAELITKAVGEKVENLLVVGIKRMILTEVQFVEIRRTNDDKFGFLWPTDVTGAATLTAEYEVPDLNTSAPARAPLKIALTGGSSMAFQFMFQDNYARLLAQPKLVCASGEKAEFLAGGEVPIPLLTNNMFTVEWKEYGIKLKIKPTADRQGNIQTEIEAEASEPDPAVSVTAGGNLSIPGFRTRKVNTNVTVRHGETIVMSGIFEHEETKAVSKNPLGYIPIIGELFKHRGFGGTKRELVVFVTPRIVNPESERIRKIIDDIKNRYKQARDEVTFSIFD